MNVWEEIVWESKEVARIVSSQTTTMPFAMLLTYAARSFLALPLTVVRVELVNLERGRLTDLHLLQVVVKPCHCSFKPEYVVAGNHSQAEKGHGHH